MREFSGLVMTLHHYSWALASRGMHERAHTVGRRAMEIADRLGDPRSRAFASASFLVNSTGITPLLLDAFVREADRALRDAEGKPERYVRNWARFVVSWCYMHRGRRSEDIASAMISRGRARNDPRALGIGSLLGGSNTWTNNSRTR